MPAPALAPASGEPPTLLFGSPDPSFPLTRSPLVIPSTQPAGHLLDPEDLIRTGLRQPNALEWAADPEDLAQTYTRVPPEPQPVDADADPEDLIRTTLRPVQPFRGTARVVDAEVLLKTHRLEQHELLDTLALRELEQPPDLEARLPPLPPPRARKRTRPPAPPPPRASPRALMIPPHPLSVTIRRAQTPALGIPRRATGMGSAWLWAAGLGLCSMGLAYAITDHIVSSRSEPDAVLREPPPAPRALKASAALTQSCAAASCETAGGRAP